MKINLLKRLLIFGGITFGSIVLVILTSSMAIKSPVWNSHLFVPAMIIFYVGLLIYFVMLLKSAGIWIAYSLPSRIKYDKWPWIKTALLASTTAGLALAATQIPWMPIVWRGFAVPAIFSICLFYFLWGVLGPILSKSSTLNFSRVFAFLFISPILALIPLTSFFVSHSLVTSYFKSYPGKFNYIVEAIDGIPEELITEGTIEKGPEYLDDNYANLTESLKVIRTAVLTNSLCLEKKKEVTKLLDKATSEDQLYWAIKGVRCAELPSVIAVPKLLALMYEHPKPLIRASAIMAIGRYSTNVVRNAAYLIIKRISSSEPPEVVEAAAMVLKKLGGNDEKLVASRLKNIMSPENSDKVGHLLITYFQGQEDVGEFVNRNLVSTNQKAKTSAIKLICELENTYRPTSNESIQSVIQELKNKSQLSSTMKALSCLGEPGFLAIKQQVEQPNIISRDIALSVFNEIPDKDPQSSLETLKTCVNEPEERARYLCSKGIGQVGAMALPMILDLIKAENSRIREVGQVALSFIKDQSVMAQLKTLRDENSGWLSTSKNLKVAESIQIAIARIEATTASK